MTFPSTDADASAQRALPYPGDDPGQLDLLHIRIRDGRGALAHAFDVLSDAGHGLDAAWQGDEADLATGETRQLVSICRQAVHRLDGAAQAVSDHCVTIRQVRSRIEALRQDWSDGLQTAMTIAESKRTHPATSTLCVGLGGGDLDECGDAQMALKSLTEQADNKMSAAKAGWRTQVQIAQHSADTCIVALQQACAGSQVQAPGLAGTHIGLAATLGVDGLAFDDQVRAQFGRSNWKSLSAAQRTYYLALGRAALGPEPVPTGASLAQTWSTLDPLSRLALIHDDPARWGNADGVPAQDRDQTNRMALDAAVNSIVARTADVVPPLPALGVDPADHKNQVTAALTAAGYSGADLEAARGTLAVNYQLYRTAHHELHAAPVQLLIFQPTAFGGRGRAAIALGDVATADNVAMLVPGMTSNVPDYLDNQVGNALTIVDTVAANDLPTTAVVAYIGYNAPDIDLSVIDQQYSDAGGKVVAADVAGLRLMRTDDPGHLTVIAHSYGSTTASTAFAQDHAGAGPGVTDLVMIGSPGAGRAKTAADEGLPKGHVWVGSASSDPVTTIAQELQDPNRTVDVDCEAGGAAGAAVGKKQPGNAMAVGALLGCAGGVIAGKKATNAIQPNLGWDPAGQAFGGIRFAAETPSNNQLDFDNHSLYYHEKTESLSNIVNIIVGDYDAVTTVPTRLEAGAHFDGGDPAANHVPDYHPPGG